VQVPKTITSITFEKNLQMQISFITSSINEIDDTGMICSIEALDILLTPYQDEKYTEAKERIKDEAKKFVAKHHPEDRSEAQKQVVYESAKKMLRELMLLMHRKDLLGER